MDQLTYGRNNLICRSRRMLSALVDNTNWRWSSLIYITSHNSWMTWGWVLWRIKHKVSYHTKAESNNCFTIHSKYFQAQNMHASSCYVTLCVKVLAFKTFATLWVKCHPFSRHIAASQDMMGCLLLQIVFRYYNSFRLSGGIFAFFWCSQFKGVDQPWN